jgi:hypothetical protein
MVSPIIYDINLKITNLANALYILAYITSFLLIPMVSCYKISYRCLILFQLSADVGIALQLSLLCMIYLE